MNIKSMFPSIGPNPVRVVDKVKTAIKSDHTNDRDANGQQAFQQNQQQQHREPMSDEKFNESIELLRNLPPVLEHNWKISPVLVDGKRFVLVIDSAGTIIRRIPELDLWSLSLDKEIHSGNIFSKTA